MQPVKNGAPAAVAAAGLSVVSLGLGVALMARTGAGGFVAAGGDARLASAGTLLAAAELAKMASAMAVGGVIAALLAKRAVNRRLMRFAAAVGYIGSAVLFASAVIGLVGLFARVGSPQSIAWTVHVMGLAAMALTGAWAGLAALADRGLPRWLKVAAWLFALASIATLAAPAAGLAAFLFGLAWFLGVAAALRAPRNGYAAAV